MSQDRIKWIKTKHELGEQDVLFINRIVSGSITPTGDGQFACMLKSGLTKLVTVKYNTREVCRTHICAYHSIPNQPEIQT